MDNEVKQEEVKETPKKSNKTLIIVLSIVGGLVLLGIIGFIAVYNLIIKPVVTVQEEAKDKINNILEQGEEIQNKIIDEANEQLENIEEELEEKTLYTFTENNFKLEVIGTLEEQKLYVNDKEITEYATNSSYFDKYSVSSFNNFYVLTSSSGQAQLSSDYGYVFDANGNLIGTLPTSLENITDEKCQTKCNDATITIANNQISVKCSYGFPRVYNEGDAYETTYYYNIVDSKLTLDHYENNTYHE